MYRDTQRKAQASFGGSSQQKTQGSLKRWHVSDVLLMGTIGVISGTKVLPGVQVFLDVAMPGCVCLLLGYQFWGLRETEGTTHNLGRDPSPIT